MNYFRYPVLNTVRRTKKGEKKIAVVGAGRIGSWVVYYLVKRGYRLITSIDGDRVTVDTVMKENETIYTHFDIGSYKVDALERKIMKKFPYTSFTKHRLNLNPGMPVSRLHEIFDDSVLIVWAADSRESLRMTEIPDLMLTRLSIASGMHARQGGGFVIFWVPLISPCIKHSLGLESFEQFRPGRAQDANIDVRDVKAVVKSTLYGVDFLLSFRLNHFLNDIDIRRHNFIEVEKHGRFYKKNLLNQGRGRNCPLCGAFQTNN